MPRLLDFILVFVISLLFVQLGYAQSNDWLAQRSNLRVRVLRYTKDTVALDTLTILNAYTEVKDSTGALLDKKQYFIGDGKIIWRKPLKINALYTVRYRVLPFRLEQATAHKDTSWFLVGAPKLNRNGSDYDYSFRYDPYKNRKERSILDGKGLDYSGSLARGISVGNAQDLVLNSQLNLQLSGKIGDDIEILGSISDQNVPLQPEGNTQRLQQFDKIFLQIKRKNTILTVGDYDLQRPNAYFTNYYRRLQGGQFSLTINDKRSDTTAWRQSYNASGAISRGRFVRQNITAIEGNQGPYRLSGANNERFVIILAGTEKVFIDGVLLKRGQDNDYTINYNSGEVYFTPRQLITKDKRVVVEFTYTEQRYTRFVTAANGEWQAKKGSFHVNYYAEADSKNLSGQDSLSTAAQLRLSEVGDSLQYAFMSGARVAENGYNPLEIQYALRDTTIAGVTLNYYGLARVGDNLVYTVSFSEVGAGKGFYTIDNQSTANGRVYRWLAPDSTGKRLGNYEPIINLTPPKSQALYAIGGDYLLAKNFQLIGEVALSDKDLNQYSERDKADNLGIAAKIILALKPIIPTGLSARNSWSGNLNYEYVQRNFNAIDPYRSVEFARDWNTSAFAATDEHWFGGSLGVQNNHWGSVQYNMSFLYKDTIYNGFKNDINIHFKYKNWTVKTVSSYLESQSKIEKTSFLRPNLDVFSTFYKNKIKIGAYAEMERNARSKPNSDTLSIDSRYYYLYRAYIQNTDTTKLNFLLSAQHRDDLGGKNTPDFVMATRANDLNLTGGWQISKAQNLRFNFTYRQLEISDSTLSPTKKPQDTYLGRLTYAVRLWRNALVFQNIYEIGNGQEQQIEYTYREVPAGQGQYTWFDRNNDGIQQLNEFEVSVFTDKANYVRFTTFTGRYVRSNLVNLSQTLQISPRAYWGTTTNPFKQFLNRFSTQSSVQINRKTLSGGGLQPFNPYQTNTADSTLVSTNAIIRNTLFFNKIEQVFGAEWTWQQSDNKQVLVSGYESRSRAEQELKIRYNPSPSWGITNDAHLGTKGNDSQLFDDRDYAIAYYSLAPKLTWIHRQKLRLAAGYEYHNAKNTIGQETALSDNFILEGTFAQAASSSFNLKVSAINMRYQGVADSPVGFALLEGLQNGQNLLWTLTWDKTIGKNLQLSVSYDGRQTGTNSPIVHVGRMQLRAIF